MTRAQPAYVREDSAPAVTQRTSWISGGPAFVYVALLVAAILLFSFVRIRLRNMPLERDEGEYAYAGQLLLHGLAPYKHLYSVKLPGVYAAYAVMMSAFGESAAGIHIGLLLVNVLSTLLLYGIVHKLFGKLSALLAGAAYALLAAAPQVNGFGAHATQFVVMFALAAIWALLKGLETGSRALIFAAGLLFGAAFMMKQPGAVFTLWAALYLVRCRWKRPVAWRRLSAELALLLAGAALPYAVTCLLMVSTGEFRAFWFWTFSYVRDYGSAVPVGDGLKLFVFQFKSVLHHAPGIWLLAFAGLIAIAASPRTRGQVFFVYSLLLFSFAGVSAGLYFRPHYFVLLLPVLSILAGVGVGCATEALAPKGRLLATLPALIFLLAFGSSIYLQRSFFFNLSPSEALRSMYGYNPFPEALEVGNYIRAHTARTDTVAVLGSEPEIYFYAQRLSASPYIYMYPLLEPEDSALDMQRQMIAQIEASRPAMLVLVNVPMSWITYSKLGSMHTILEWARPYLKEQYVQDGVVEVRDGTDRYFWGDEARGYEPKTHLSILVFRRR